MNTARIAELVEKVQSIPNPGARETALELVQAVMDLHAAGLERMLEILSDAEAGGVLLDAFASDKLVSSILLLHDLHPLDLETRVSRALRGTGAELLSIREGVVRVRMNGGSREEVEAAVMEAAPDAAAIEVESAADFVPLAQLMAR